MRPSTKGLSWDNNQSRYQAPGSADWSSPPTTLRPAKMRKTLITTIFIVLLLRKSSGICFEREVLFPHKQSTGSTVFELRPQSDVSNTCDIDSHFKSDNCVLLFTFEHPAKFQIALQTPNLNPIYNIVTMWLCTLLSRKQMFLTFPTCTFLFSFPDFCSPNFHQWAAEGNLFRQPTFLRPDSYNLHGFGSV